MQRPLFLNVSLLPVGNFPPVPARKGDAIFLNLKKMKKFCFFC